MAAALEGMPASKAKAAIAAKKIPLRPIPEGLISELARKKAAKGSKLTQKDLERVYSQIYDRKRFNMVIPKEDEYGRLHTEITGLNKDFREYLGDVDDPHVELDIKSSQPAFMGHEVKVQLRTNMTALFQECFGVTLDDVEADFNDILAENLVARIVSSDGLKEVAGWLYLKPQEFATRLRGASDTIKRATEGIDWRDESSWPQMTGEALKVVTSVRRWNWDVLSSGIYETLQQAAGCMDLDRSDFKYERFYPYIYGPDLSTKIKPVMQAVQSLYPVSTFTQPISRSEVGSRRYTRG